MKQIFVFGSNLAGRHGRGSALEAVRYHGAKIGVGSGPQGNAYGIPTKDAQLNILPLEEIRPFVNHFIVYASLCQDAIFNVVAIGCGLAGYRPEQIAPMFKHAPDNVRLPDEFKKALGR